MRSATRESTVTRTGRLSDYCEVAKLRLSLLVLFTVGVGFAMAGSGGAGSQVSIWLLVHTLTGVGLCAAGSAALNMYIERDLDALMDRTRDRPLPAGRLTNEQVLVFGVSCIAIGLSGLVFLVNWLAALLAAVSVVVYVFLYTPLKRLTTLNTLVGAVTGALPPMIGWVAATGEIATGAWILFMILFVWQLPHFFALALLFRADYSRAGMRMLGVEDADGRLAARQTFLFTLMLVPVSLLPVIAGLAGVTYFVAALVLGLAFLGTAVTLVVHRTRSDARRLFLMSLVYLPCLLGVLLADGMLGS